MTPPKPPQGGVKSKAPKRSNPIKPKKTKRPPSPPAFLSSLPRLRLPNETPKPGREISLDASSNRKAGKPKTAPHVQTAPTAAKALTATQLYDQRNGSRLPKAIAALPTQSMAALQQMWVNLLPYLTGKPRSKVAHALRDALIAEWSRRTQIAITDPDRFDWPSTDAPGGAGGLNAAGWYGLGMFGFLGYRVGVTQGVAQHSRQHILETIFAEPLPPLNGLAYWLEWGKPQSAARLQKMAETLAANVRNAKRRQSVDLGAAIADWEGDLRFLYAKYYVGHFRFGWPTL